MRGCIAPFFNLRDMEAKELRIDNYVYIKGIVDVITGIGDNDFCSEKYGHGLDNKQVEPIPLTEEWLLKFGFKITAEDSDKTLYRMDKKNFIIVSHEWGCDFHYGVSGNDWIKPYFVHSLQNLYFALTGEELTLNQ